MNRHLSNDDIELDPDEQMLDVVGEMDSPPPPGFDVEVSPPPPPGFDPNTAPPPPGFDSNTTPPPPNGFVPHVENIVDSSAVPEPTTDSPSPETDYSGWSDEMLIAQGWTQWQVDTWRTEQGGVVAPQTSLVGAEIALLGAQPDVPESSQVDATLPANHPAAEYKFSDSVVDSVMKTHGITDKSAFMYHAIEFDKDGNNYLNGKELEEAAKSFTN